MTSLTDTVCGIDEAGRGAFAGPLVCAAVVLPDSFELEDFPKGYVFRDSKKMSAKQRRDSYEQIKKFALAVESEFIGVEFINKNGVGRANKVGIANLIKRVNAGSYVVDGNMDFGNSLTTSVIRADSFVPSVICAGIVAKVLRDRHVETLPDGFLYKWRKNMGYGTKEHRNLILKYGTTPFHRMDFIKTFKDNMDKKQNRQFLVNI